MLPCRLLTNSEFGLKMYCEKILWWLSCFLSLVPHNNGLTLPRFCIYFNLANFSTILQRVQEEY